MARGTWPQALGPTLLLIACGLGLTAIVQADNSNRIFGAVTILDSRGQRLDDNSNVVVFLDGFSRPYTGGQNSAAPKISHKGRKFSPRVLPIVRGSEVDFFNDDSIFHNVFSLSRAKAFDLGIYPEGTSKVVSFETPGLVKLYCNIHPDMVSNILVLNNPFYATTDERGNYSLDNVPDGEFTLRTWYELGEEQSIPLSLLDSSVVEKNLELLETKRIRQHKNKFNKNYKSKY